MGDQQQFCLRWNNHGATLVAVFDSLFNSESLVDVTLFCEGQLLKAHKVVLSACSPYFQKLFAQTSDRHPIVILKDVKHDELKALLKYMYKGEVNVSQEQLGSLIKTAESLQIKGLADGNKNGEVASSKPTPAPSAESSTESSVENRNGRMGIDFPPATMASVLNTALTMPSNLSLSPHIRLPVPQPEPMTRDSDGESSPLSKKRKKMRRKSGGTPESVDSDVRSACSPPEGSVHPFPRIPATITPLSQIQAAAAALHPIHREQLQMLRERELERERERARDRDHDSEPGRLQIDIMKDSESKTDREQTADSNGEVKRPGSPSDNQVGSSNVDGNFNPPRSSPLQLTMRPTSELLESTPTKQPHSNESMNQGYSSDANHHSDNDDDDDGSSSDRAGHEYPDGAGPSTSHLNFGESPQPGYLSGWPYVPADHSQGEESFNPLSENTNQGIWNSDFKGGLLGPYLGTPLAPLHPRSNPHLAPPFPGLYGPPPHPWGRHSPPTSGLPISAHHNECNRCGRLYKTRKGLKHHIKNECGVEPRFQCHHCDWKFKQKAHLLRHVARKHSVQREDPPYSNVPRENSPYTFPNL
ncbi:unnamed protein product, partial [Meganyctiphanes norvegica]